MVDQNFGLELYGAGQSGRDGAPARGSAGRAGWRQAAANHLGDSNLHVLFIHARQATNDPILRTSDRSFLCGSTPSPQWFASVPVKRAAISFLGAVAIWPAG